MIGILFFDKQEIQSSYSYEWESGIDTLLRKYSVNNKIKFIINSPGQINAVKELRPFLIELKLVYETLANLITKVVSLKMSILNLSDYVVCVKNSTKNERKRDHYFNKIC